MSFSSQKETCGPNTPSGSSSRTSINGELHRRSSKATIHSHQGSISNSSVHTATAGTHKDLPGPSGQGPLPSVSHHSSDSSSGRVPSISDLKSFQSLQKQTFSFRNQSVSTVCTVREPESNLSFTPTSTSKQKYRSLNFSSLEDEAESSLPSVPRFSRAITPTLMTDPSPNPNPVHAVTQLTPSPPVDDGDFQPLTTAETPITDTPSIRPPSFLLRPADLMGTISRSRSGTVTAKGKKRVLGFMTDFLKPNKRPEISTPHDPLHLTHVGFDSSTRRITGLPTDWQRRLEDSDISGFAQEKDLPAIVKFYQEGGGNVWDRTNHAPDSGSSPSSPVSGAAHAAYSVSESVDDDRLLPTPALSRPKISHSSGDPQNASPSHLPASYRPAPSLPRPVQCNLERSNSRRSLPKPPHSDTLIRASTKDWHLLTPGVCVLFFF